MLLGGLWVLALGIGVMIISVPLMLVIIGFFTLLGGFAIGVCGYTMMATSKYKSVNCPKCSHMVNSRGQNEMLCLTCKNIVHFKDGKN